MYSAEPSSKDGASGGGKPLSETAFRVEEKRYRQYRIDPRQVRKGKAQPVPETDFADVVDARAAVAGGTDTANTAANKAMLHIQQLSSRVPASAASSPRLRESVCSVTFDGVPGLTIFPNLLTDAEQRALCVQSLTDFVKPPHPNNVSTLDPTYVAADGYEPKLRWATLGYAYNWTTRTYKDVSHATPFPTTVSGVVEEVVSLLPRLDTALAPVSAGYEAQTAIVNFYPVGTSMMAHQDVSEACLHRPLVSLSLGCSSVFLMGTESRDDKPFAFWLRSGDVAVFTGPSRLAYHAVPRILDDCPAHLLPPAAPDAPAATAAAAGGGGDPASVPSSSSLSPEEAALAKMQGLRININVRQVYDAANPAPSSDACAAEH